MVIALVFVKMIIYRSVTKEDKEEQIGKNIELMSFLCPSINVYELQLSHASSTPYKNPPYDICDPYSSPKGNLIVQVLFSEIFMTTFFVYAVLFIKNNAFTLRNLSQNELAKILMTKLQNI
jgi:hypothetical protein